LADANAESSPEKDKGIAATLTEVRVLFYLILAYGCRV
jgi:hypothetical protein